MTKLDVSFYQRDDVVSMARSLLGKVLVTNRDGVRTEAVILETEAYHQDERGCHAYNGKRTKRTETLFQAGGIAYVYLCYGIHHLFNVVTGGRDSGQAVLIRAVHPIIGLEHMLERRKMAEPGKRLAAGPGTLSQALGITTEWDGVSLDGPEIWIEDRNHRISESVIESGPRIGIDYAGEDALLPWRFVVKAEAIHT